QTIAADEQSIIRQEETKAARAMPWNFQYLELRAEKIPARRLFDQKVRLRRLDFEFCAEATEEFAVRSHRRSERVTADLVTKLSLDPGDILYVIDVLVCHE